MATLRDIKRRITSVKSTQQITNAMKMVSAAKLRRAQERLMNSRPYAEGLQQIIAHVAAQEDPDLHPLLQVRAEHRRSFLVITSDRGLCGSFNANVTRRAKSEVELSSKDEPAAIINFGRKGYEFFHRRGYAITSKYINLFNELSFHHATQLAEEIGEAYRTGQYDRVDVVYNYFKSAGAQEVRVERLLPIVPQAPQSDKFALPDYIYEPSPKAILEEAIPKNLTIQIWRSLLESSAAEHAARMVAMDSATENAKEMIYQLTLTYNKARQAAITTEISEIVGGAEALRG